MLEIYFNNFEKSRSLFFRVNLEIRKVEYEP
jgi:hypothetical protein